MNGEAVWGLWETNASRQTEEEDHQTGKTDHFLPLWYPWAWAQPGLEPRSGHWCEQSSRSPLDLAQEQKRELWNLREDAEVPLPLLLFPPSSCTPWSCGSSHNGCDSIGARILREGSLPPQSMELWSQEGGANLVACFFFSFQSSTAWPCGCRSRVTKTSWPEDQRGEHREPEVTRRWQRGTSSCKRAHNRFCELLGLTPSLCLWVGS